MPDRPLTLPRVALRRCVQAVPLLAGVIVVNFTLIHLAPGDPITVIVGDFPAPPDLVRQLRTEFGLDLPLWRQLLIYFGKLLGGDLGFSYANRQAVLALVVERLPATLLLTGSAMVLAALLGAGLGVAASRRPYSWLDNVTSVVGLLGFSMPVFWLGQLLIIGVSLGLGWLPAQGMVSLRADPSGWGRALSVAHHLILPTLTLSAGFLALNARVARASMLEVLRQEYVLAARAKGLGEWRVVYGHALRNALIPIVTVIGFNVGYLLGGSAFVETIFAWPGIGRLLYDAMFARDYPTIMGIFLLVSMGVIVANLLADLAYAWLDPRVRY